MKSLSIFFLFIIAIFSLNAQSSCDLNNFAYSVIEDGDVFYISVEQPAEIYEKFNVYVNGSPIENPEGKFGPFKADCNTFYSLAVYKKGQESCNVTANIGIICSSDECYINDIEVSYPECNPNGIVYVTLDFNYANVSDSFTVNGNGIFYGEFSYADLPIQLGPITPDCDKEYEFVIKDSQNTNCASDIGGIIICCPINCIPPVFEIATMECSEEGIKMKLILLESFTSTNLSIKINDEYLSTFEIDSNFIYLSSELPLNIVNHVITVCNVGIVDECCFSQEFNTDDCTIGNGCNIYGMTYSMPDCQPNEEVFINLDFKYNNLVSDSFMVKGNGINYGEFAYADLPVSIGPFESSCYTDIVYELISYDSQDPSCSSSLENLIICCNDSCLEPIFEVLDMICDSNNIKLKLEIFHPLYFDELEITLNGTIVYEYIIDFPYVYLEIPFPSLANNYDLRICSPYNNVEFCCYSQVLDFSDCNGSGECKIGEIEVYPSECSDAQVLPYFNIDFNYTGVGNKGFSVKGNGFDYGDFNYEDLPITVTVEDSCGMYYEFVIIDNEYNCSSEVEYGYHCCTDYCSFRVKDTRVRCDDGLINEIAFFLKEETDPLKHYAVYAYGQLIGETDENNVFLEFETQIPVEGIEQLELKVCDDECCVTSILDISECYNEPEECSISDIQLNDLTCGQAALNFTLDFEYQGTTSNEFDVFSAFGFYGTFSYDELPLKIENYPALNLGLNVIFICDKGTFCCQTKLFSSPSCLIFGAGEDNVSYTNELSKEQTRYIRTNPTGNELILDSPYKLTKYYMYNSAGQIVKTIESETLETIVDTSIMASGMYIIRIENESGIKIEKLLIAK